MWLAFSNDVLGLEELAEIFILRPDGTVPVDEAARLFEPRDVLKYFSSLVLVQKDRDARESVRLAHFSIKEYLTSRRITNGPAARFGFSEIDAHLHLARSCIAYHLQVSALDKEAGTTWFFSLRYYVACNWPWHLEMVPRELWPTELASAAGCALATRSQSLENMLHGDLWNIDFRITDPGDPEGPDFGGWPDRMLRQPLCYTARLGFFNLTEILLSSHEYLVQEDLDAALADAAYGGSTAVVDLLLDRAMPADINAASKVFGDALRAAAYAGHVETIEHLLDRGADIDAQRGQFNSALQAACAMGHVGAVELLLGRGANAKLPSGAFGGVLTSAVKGGSLKILQLLLDSGAYPELGGGMNDTNGDETPLHAAARNLSRSLPLFHLLLERGADVNAGGGEYGHPLQALCSSVTTEPCDLRAAVELLLYKGAEINARGGKYGSALQCACQHHMTDSDLNIVKVLLDRGADPDARGGYFGTPLQAACTHDNFQSIGRLLVENGADVHAQGGYY